MYPWGYQETTAAGLILGTDRGKADGNSAWPELECAFTIDDTGCSWIRSPTV